MNSKENKKHYDLKNVYYAPGHKNDDGTITYEKPIREFGAMSMDVSPEGDVSKTRADGIDYLVVSTNSGYKGNLNFVRISDRFKRDCLGEKVDLVNGIQYEDADVEPQPFALLFEFSGDKKAQRYVLYNVIASRPSINGENKDTQQEPDTDELEITASPSVIKINDDYKNIVKSQTTMDTKPDVYQNWFNVVYLPETDSSVDTTLKSLTIDTLVLAPVFDKDIHTYSSTTNEPTNTITVSASDTKATTEIKVNDVVVPDGKARWEDGENTVLITVTNGSVKGVYSVIVTKEKTA